MFRDNKITVYTHIYLLIRYLTTMYQLQGYIVSNKMLRLLHKDWRGSGINWMQTTSRVITVFIWKYWGNHKALMFWKRFKLGISWKQARHVTLAVICTVGRYSIHVSFFPYTTWWHKITAKKTWKNYACESVEITQPLAFSHLMRNRF
jgi:hypothetical protein